MRTLKLRIEQDQDAQNPREDFDQASLIWITPRNRYLRSDKGAEENPPKGSVIFPLYMYAHGGATISLGRFSCPWDSGQCGIVYITPETGRKEWGRKWRKKAEDCIRAEVKTLDMWLTGDVWGFVIEDEDGDHVESCWGFYGHDECQSEGESVLKYLREQDAKDEAKESAEREEMAARDVVTVD